MPRMQGNTVDSNNYFFIDWNLNSQNVGGNYSNISWWAYWHFQGNDRQLDNGYANLGDVNRWSNGGRIYNYSGNFSTRDMLLASGSLDIGHNADGTKTLNVAGGTTGYNGSRSEGSGSWGLPTIARASQPSVNTWPGNSPNVNIGDNATIHMNSASGSFRHTVIVDFGSFNKTIGTNITNNVVWDTSVDAAALYARIPNANQGGGTITVHTYNGGTYIGTKTCAITLIIPAGTANPTFTAAQISYEDTDAAVVAITTNDQIIVQSKSDLEVTFTSATPQKSATITNYKVTLDTNVQNKTTGSTIDYGEVNLSSNTPVTIEVTDSRGNKTTATKTISILPWLPPRAVITAGRVNNYEDSTNLKADVTIDSVDGKNAIQSIALRYKKTSDVTWTSTTMTSGVVKNLTLDKLYEWNIEITITDKFGSTVYTSTITKGIPIMFFDTVKLSMGVGMFPAGNETLEVADKYLIPIMKKVYPIGRIIMTTNSTNPGTLPELAGTTWAVWGTGRVPVGFDSSQTEFNTVEKTSGAKTHTLTEAEMPSHRHQQGGLGYYYIGGAQENNLPASGSVQPWDRSNLSEGARFGRTTYTGGSGAHNNLQPGIVCYFWKRTA